MPPKKKPSLSAAQKQTLLETLEARFVSHLERHREIAWGQVSARLEAHPEKLGSLHALEQTQGEPDVVGQDPKTGEILFFDCSPQSPKGRESLCYDRDGWESRKEHRPRGNAVDEAAAMGVELLTEEQYHQLQKLGEFDTKSSSWLQTPPDVRARGGAIFGDRRYDRVFVYHNGAQSYYSGRGFRACLRI